MHIAESPPNQERQELIDGVTGDAAAMLGVDLGSDSPQQIVTKVNDAIVALVFGKPTPVAGLVLYTKRPSVAPPVMGAMVDRLAMLTRGTNSALWRGVKI